MLQNCPILSTLIPLTWFTFSSTEEGFAGHEVGNGKVNCHTHYKWEGHPIPSSVMMGTYKMERERGGGHCL